MDLNFKFALKHIILFKELKKKKIKRMLMGESNQYPVTFLKKY